MSSESESEVAQLRPTLCDPMDYSLPGSSIHGIFQSRVLEWVAISLGLGKLQLLLYIAGTLEIIMLIWRLAVF